MTARRGLRRLGQPLRVVRGGSFYDAQRDLRVACRYYYDPDGRSNYIVFRVVVSPFSSDSEL